MKMRISQQDFLENESDIYRGLKLTHMDLDRADFTLLMIAGLEHPYREQQFLKITLALSCKSFAAEFNSLS